MGPNQRIFWTTPQGQNSRSFTSTCFCPSLIIIALLGNFPFLFPWPPPPVSLGSVSQRAVPEARTSASPGKWEIQLLWPHPDLLNQKLGLGLCNLCLNKSYRWGRLKFESISLGTLDSCWYYLWVCCPDMAFLLWDREISWNLYPCPQQLPTL